MNAQKSTSRWLKSTEWLASQLDNKDVVIVDLSLIHI